MNIAQNRDRQKAEGLVCCKALTNLYNNRQRATRSFSPKNDLVGSKWPLMLYTYAMADSYEVMGAGARPLAHKKEMNNAIHAVKTGKCKSAL